MITKHTRKMDSTVEKVLGVLVAIGTIATAILNATKGN